MSVTKKYIELLRKLIRKSRFRTKLRRMDDWWYLIGGCCFELFPPSFYYTHMEEEIKRITEEELDILRAIRDKYISEYDPKLQVLQKEVE